MGQPGRPLETGGGIWYTIQYHILSGRVPSGETGNRSLFGQGGLTMDDYTTEELTEARRRIRAFEIAMDLIEEKLNTT